MTKTDTVNPRRIAWEVMGETGKSKTWLEDRVDGRLATSRMSVLDQRLCRELCFGTVKMQKFLDALIDPCMKQPTKTPEKLRRALRLGAYQLFCMDRIPEHAAVHETVAMVKRVLPLGQAKMVNAVLRELQRRGAPKFPDPEKDPVAYLSVKYSFPEYIASRWHRRYGLEASESMMRQANTAPQLTARVNTCTGTREQALARLRSQGVQAEAGIFPEAILIGPGQASPAAILEQNPTWIYFQDQAAQVIGWLVDPPAQGICLDLCAAPGGKTTHIAALMENRGQVLAYDVTPQKRARVADNAKRLGFSNIRVLDTVQSVPPCDRVLVDAPCSGLGTLRRHVETRWRLRETDHRRLAKMQLDLLAQASTLVKPDGHLIYATCTTEPEENEQVVNAFLENHPEFILSPGPGNAGIPDAANWEAPGFFKTYPAFSEMDAMFAARLIRRA